MLKTLHPEKRTKEIMRISRESGITILFLNKYDFAKYFDRKNKNEGITQGVIGFIKDYKYKTLREIVDNNRDVINPLILILDQITDPHNLGAIIRSAVSFGADGIVIPRHNSAEINHTVLKTSSGTANHISIAKETNLNNTILFLKDNGYKIIGADINSEKNIFETDFRLPAGLVIGSEGAGMRKLLKQNCDIIVRIPMSEKSNSLNVSVSTAVFLYEIFRQKNN